MRGLPGPSRAVRLAGETKRVCSGAAETRPDCPPPLLGCFWRLRICAAHRDTPLTSPCGGAGAGPAARLRVWHMIGWARGEGRGRQQATPPLCCPPSLCLLSVDTHLFSEQSSALELESLLQHQDRSQKLPQLLRPSVNLWRRLRRRRRRQEAEQAGSLRRLGAGCPSTTCPEDSRTRRCLERYALKCR